MKSIYSYISFYVRSLERERDELLNRLLEANQIRPLGGEEGTLSAPTPQKPIQAYSMGHRQALEEMSRCSLEEVKGIYRREKEKKSNGGDNAT